MKMATRPGMETETETETEIETETETETGKKKLNVNVRRGRGGAALTLTMLMLTLMLLLLSCWVDRSLQQAPIHVACPAGGCMADASGTKSPPYTTITLTEPVRACRIDFIHISGKVSCNWVVDHYPNNWGCKTSIFFIFPIGPYIYVMLYDDGTPIIADAYNGNAWGTESNDYTCDQTVPESSDAATLNA